MTKFLVIRRDNIGDLVCTTPMLSVLRRHYPNAWIGVLANSYNVDVLYDNPDIDEVFFYRKVKHRALGESRLRIWHDTAGLILTLRRKRIDVAVVPSPGGQRYARLAAIPRILDDKSLGGKHEVERCVAMLGALDTGLHERVPGKLTLRANANLVYSLAGRAGLGAASGVRIAVHLSARRPKQQWPVESFIRVIQELLVHRLTTQIVLFWAPGSKNDPAHPGDDEKMGAIAHHFAGNPSIVPFHTSTLGELVAGLSLCDLLVCSDGGAMHVAAGLGKPIVCMFGDADASRWHPWGVPHEVLQPASRDVKDLSCEEVIAACRRLLNTLKKF